MNFGEENQGEARFTEVITVRPKRKRGLCLCETCTYIPMNKGRGEKVLCEEMD